MTAFCHGKLGLNLGVWQFRDESVYTSYSGGHKGWKNNSRYLYRPISRILSALTLGIFIRRLLCSAALNSEAHHWERI